MRGDREMEKAASNRKVAPSPGKESCTQPGLAVMSLPAKQQSTITAPLAGIYQEPLGELHRHILLCFPWNWALNSHLLLSSPAVPRPKSCSSGDMHVTPGLGKREPGDR